MPKVSHYQWRVAQARQQYLRAPHTLDAIARNFALMYGVKADQVKADILGHQQ